ncbi:MAG: thioredoxin family protein [Planctomycetes bacterium]|nr:thioredoxin family protein [Planctomycetota bacterium]
MLSVGNTNYDTALEAAEKSGKPLVVLVGADWCPGCRTMKQTSIPQLQKQGGLDRVAFATVNTDQQSSLANRLTGGGSIPQLVMYSRDGEKWQRRVLIGAHSPREIERFIGQALPKTANEASE